MVFNCCKTIGFSVNVHPINNVVKQHLKIVLGIIKNHSTTLSIKMIRNYQKNFGKSKGAMEHQKLHGKLSEYVVLTIQTVSAVFYV